MAIDNLITNKEFMDEFIAATNKSWEQTGTYEDVYYGYEDEMSDDDIRELLNYLEENDLLDY
jgi:hypothetical protein